MSEPRNPQNDNKDVKKSALAEQFRSQVVAAGGEDPSKKNIGNNGYTVGQEFHCTGVLKIQESELNGKKYPWMGVETKEGTFLSLKSLMNISSLNGYLTEGKVEVESNGAKKSDPAVVTEETASVVEDFSFDMVGQPTSRNFMQFIEDADLNELFKGVTVTYLGTVVKPIVAKKDGTNFKAGMKRAITTKLWGYEL